MCRVFATRFTDCDLLTPALARSRAGAELRAELSGMEAEASIDSAILVVSELVTNALRAGSSRIELTVDVRRGGIRVAVRDDAPGMPALRHASREDEHGRGLALVAALSTRWAVDRDSSAKSVWAEIVLPPATAHASPCLEL